MSQNALISVVLPTYNGARYIHEAIDSVLAQTYQDWELIIVDDASTDETPDIIRHYAARDARIRCVRHEQNRRLPAALNSGFAVTRGDYLSWTSDDNRYRPQALATMAAVLDERSDIDFVYASFDIVDAAGNIVAQHRAHSPASLLSGATSNACFLYRRAVYEHLGDYAEDMFLAEDYDYWLRVFLSGHRMQPLSESLYEYRRHERSLTDAYRGQTFAAAERALLRNLSAFTTASAKTRGEAYLFLASLAAWRGEHRRALRYALWALRYTPGKLGRQVGVYLVRRMPVLKRSDDAP